MSEQPTDPIPRAEPHETGNNKTDTRNGCRIVPISRPAIVPSTADLDPGRTYWRCVSHDRNHIDPDLLESGRCR